MKLINKNCIVTGASRGIGKAIALELAAEGANVIIAYNSNQAQAEDVAVIARDHGVNAVAIKVDLKRHSDLEHLVQQSIQHLGNIHVLVNNAGIVDRSPFTAVTESEFDAAIAVNLKAPFFLIQQVAKNMQQHQQGGSIINITSISSCKAEQNIAAYECAKAGAAMLTKSAALALAESNIRVNSISPGLTATDMTQPKDDPFAKPLSERIAPIPLGRVGQPQDHAKAAVFLASDDAAWITGAEIIVDGGESVK